MRPSVRAFAVVCVAVGLLVGAARAQADSAVPVNAEQMAKLADLIFSGTCVGTKAGVLNGRQVATTTFKVKDVIKGKIEGDTYSFSQLAMYRPPNYTEGKEYVLFLPKPTKGGWLTPIGLGQGTFTVVKGMATNERNNRGLFNVPKTSKAMKALSAGGVEPQSQGPVKVETLVNVVREINRQP